MDYGLRRSIKDGSRWMYVEINLMNALVGSSSLSCEEVVEDAEDVVESEKSSHSGAGGSNIKLGITMPAGSLFLASMRSFFLTLFSSRST